MAGECQLFHSTNAETIAIRDEVMQFKNRKQLPRETEVEFSTQGNTIAYRCGKPFFLDYQIFTFIFKLH